MKWSYSTHRAMRQCTRQLIFGHLIAHHAGKRYPERREAYLLKQLQALSAWQGSVVHRVLATSFLQAVRAGRPIDWGALAAEAEALARGQLAFSAARRYRDPGLSKTAAGPEFCALREHEFGHEVPDAAIAAALETIRGCFDYLSSQAAFVRELQIGTRHLAERTLHFSIDGLRVTLTAQLDLVVVRRDGGITIIDWKIGESDSADYSRQLLVYALAALRCGWWAGLTPDRIELVEANLLKHEIRPHPLTAERLDEAEDFVYRSASELELLLTGESYPDIEIAEYDIAENPNTCAYCNFRSMCAGRHNVSAAMGEGLGQQLELVPLLRRLP